MHFGYQSICRSWLKRCQLDPGMCPYFQCHRFLSCPTCLSHRLLLSFLSALRTHGDQYSSNSGKTDQRGYHS
ncbi:hypothetical protein SCLCIDRAFT_293654 [Scleroderma citrinum Foug A]|uniref:Uncharacterized protein n=1 Tax=Scleroderma citrinum Foug A TaxID=1036808 RepID=A0A0C3E1P3_9AGAM|nr:hypothetical protein SCLCIDRAFT_293654 [Scleroderma citrinum Foug A]